MTQQDEDLHRRIAGAVERIATVLRAGTQQAADEAAVSPLQMRILRELTSRPGQRLGALAEALHVTDGTVSAAVKTLVEKGLAHKAPDPDEHRAVLVHPTPTGRRVDRRAEDWPDEALVPATRALGDDESGEVLAALLRLIQGLESAGTLQDTRMCHSCEWFQPWKGRGKRPHRCGLLKASIGGSELRVDCPDHVAAAPDVQAERLRELRRTS
ncbi:MAG: MarR family winged helix-turn-helix transcriptional regulator [Planctomycetota bacterium]